MKTSVHKLWEKHEILRLIERYRQHEILWNTKIPQYKNRGLKQESLRDLAKEFDTPVSEIQRKVHNLRCQLNSEIKKLKRRKLAGVEESLKSSWEYFEPLLFILSASSNEDEGSFDISDHLETMIEAEEELMIKQEEEDDEGKDLTNISNEMNMGGSDQTDTQIESDLSQDNINDSVPGGSELKDISFKALYPSLRTDMKLKRLGCARKEKCLDILDKLHDDSQIFGDFVAAELRNLKSDNNRRKLKRIIQKAILDISESED